MISPLPGQSDRPVRVCFVIDELGVAGTETQLLMLIRGLDRTIVEPFLCLLRGDESRNRGFAPEDCPLLQLDVRSLHKPSAAAAAWRFAKFLRVNRIDVVQTHFPDSTYFAAPLARLAGVRHVVRTRRDLGYWQRPIDRLIGRWVNRISYATIVNCQACADAVITQEKTPAETVFVLPNGIDMASFQEVPAFDAARASRPRRVGMVANLRPVKGPDIFVRAAALVLKDHPDTQFCIAGDGDDASLWRLADTLGIRDCLTLPGKVLDIPQFLSGLDVAVLASHSEGLSNALMEYMAAGRPIVATAVGGNPELINDQETGLLVPPADPEALAAAIGRLLANPSLAASLASAARTRLSNGFSLESMLVRHEDFYLATLGRERYPSRPAMRNVRRKDIAPYQQVLQ